MTLYPKACVFGYPVEMKVFKNRSIAANLTLLFVLLSESGYTAEVPTLSFTPAARYRVQQVNDALRGDALASTLKLRLDAKVSFSSDTSLFTQLDHIYAFNDGNFNSVVINQPTSPIPEAKGTELNNIGIETKLTPEWSMTFGRQSFSHDNERHIGAIEFWQKSQSFDAIKFAYQNYFGVSFEYAYIDQVNRIFGSDAGKNLSPNDIRIRGQSLRPTAELGKHKHESHLFKGQFGLSNTTKLTGYAYLLHNQSTPLFSSNTLGIRLEQSVKPDEFKYTWIAEGAVQQDNANNPVNYRAYYGMLQGGIQYKSHLLELTTEYIGENNGLPFATSLGTNHKFQGWVDIFTNYNPNGGLIDYSIGYRGRVKKLRWRVIFHHYAGLNEAPAIGNEWNAEIAYRFTRKWEAKFVFAVYLPQYGQPSNLSSKSRVSTSFLSINYNL